MPHLDIPVDPGLVSSLLPDPGGKPLRLTIACHTSRRSGDRGRRHDVVIHANWTAEVPHDIENERIAVALGGYLSCLDLVDSAVPALRTWLERNSRLTLPDLKFAQAGERCSVQPTARCCPASGFLDATAAARHWRTVRHIATEVTTPLRQLEALAKASGEAHASAGTLDLPADDADRAVAACIGGHHSVMRLWEAGVHPRLICRAHDQVGARSALPERFYLAVAYLRPDLAWIADALGDRNDTDPTRPGGHESLSAWLAWTMQPVDASDPTARRRWLDAGVSRSMILHLSSAGYDPSDILDYAHATGHTPDGAAWAIYDWVQQGLHPRPHMLTALHEAGHLTVRAPARAAIDRLRSHARPASRSWSQLGLAMLLAQHGTVPDAAAAIANGAQPW